MSRITLQEIKILAVRLGVPESKVKACVRAYWPQHFQPSKRELKAARVGR